MAGKTIPEAIRQLVAKRANGCCEYCFGQEKFATHRFSMDHIIPPDLGGSNGTENLALSCQGCNNYKHVHVEALDPMTKSMVPLYHPRRDEWEDHFQWNENYTVIIGVTPTGRATTELLRLNREMLVNQRVVYRAYGVHPPTPNLK